MHISDKDHVWMQRREQFQHLPSQILYDLARNESAEFRFRKMAVELLLEHGSKQAYAPEIYPVLVAVQNEQKERSEDAKVREEIISIIETAVEEPHENLGPHKASFTTQQMNLDIFPQE